MLVGAGVVGLCILLALTLEDDMADEWEWSRYPGSTVGQVLVHIGRPWQEPTGEWAAPFQILGLGRSRVSRAFGLDAIHALQLVHLMIGSTLAASDEGKQGRLRWAGEADLGFPVTELPK